MATRTSFMMLGMLIILAVVVPLVAMLVLHFARRRREPVGFPMEPSATEPQPESGPGRYRITGVVKETGADTQLFVEAQTLANAKVKAELGGVVVTEIAKE